MHVISNKARKSFVDRFPDADKPLQSWRKVMEKGSFRSFAALRQALGSVDKVGDLYVFNIGGNKYRLIAYVRFDWQRCYIKQVMTHAEYDRERWQP